MRKIKINGEIIGPILLSILLVGTSFHFIARDIFVYYRELIAIFFGVFVAKYVLKRIVNGDLAKLKIRKEVIYFCIFPIMMLLLSVGDQKIALYNNSITDASELLTEGEATVYIIRNAVLYMPMVLYFYVYGIDEKVIRYLSIIIILIAPLSTIKMIESLSLGYNVDISILLATGRDFIPYNSYVPYLTFPVLACFYLLFSKTNIFTKLGVLVILLYLLFFIFISSSRQSFLFCIVSFIVFFLMIPTHSVRNYLFVSVFLLAVLYGAQLLFQDFVIDEELISRFTTTEGAIESTRFEKIKDGIMLLNVFQLFTGAGLTSVNGGPHNDYVQWLQRLGLLPMIVSFMPYIIALKGASFLAQKSFELKPLYVYIALSIFFTLFHSFFGHPREDSFQAPFSFLGLALWLGTVRRSSLIYRINQYQRIVGPRSEAGKIV